VDHLHATVYVNAEDDDWFQVLTVNDDGTVTARQNTTGQLSQPERTFNAAHATGTTTTPFGGSANSGERQLQTDPLSNWPEERIVSTGSS